MHTTLFIQGCRKKKPGAHGWSSNGCRQPSLLLVVFSLFFLQKKEGEKGGEGKGGRPIHPREMIGVHAQVFLSRWLGLTFVSSASIVVACCCCCLVAIGLYVARHDTIGCLFRQFVRAWGLEHRRVFTDHQVHSVWNKRNGYCHICSRQITRFEPRRGVWDIDHRIPWSRGGSNAEWNLWPAHTACNIAKSNKTETQLLRGDKARRVPKRWRAVRYWFWFFYIALSPLAYVGGMAYVVHRFGFGFGLGN